MHELRRDGRTTVLVGNMPPVDRMPAYLACLPGAVATDVRCQLPVCRRPLVVRELVASYNAAIARVVRPRPRCRSTSQGRDLTRLTSRWLPPSTAGHRMVAAAFARRCPVGALMLAVTLRGILSHKLRLLLSASAITLGIAFLAGTMVLTDTLRTSVDDLQTTLSGGSDVSVRSGSATGRTSRIGPGARRLLDLPAAGPRRRVRDRFVAGLRPGPGLARPLVGAGASVGTSMPPGGLLQVHRGRAPHGAGEVALDVDSANNAHLRVGDRVTC